MKRQTHVVPVARIPDARGAARWDRQAWEALARTLTATARRAHRVGALGNIGADATGNPKPADPRFRRLSPELTSCSTGGRVARARGPEGRAAEGCRHHAGVDGCRGLDHGAWVPLRWSTRNAAVPVVQSFGAAGGSARAHLRLGRALARPPRQCAHRRLRPHHAQPARLDWPTRARQEPLRYAEAFAGWVGEPPCGARRASAARVSRPGARRPCASVEEHFTRLRPVAAPPCRRRDAAHRRRIRGRALAMDSYLFRQRAA